MFVATDVVFTPDLDETASRTPARNSWRNPASMTAAAVLTLLAAGLVPVWALALQTPFRLIDDYGALLPLERLPTATLLRETFSLRENPVRFRPTHDLGQMLCWYVFGPSPAAHHALRLGMKLAAFAAFVGVAWREVKRATGRAPRGGQTTALLALAVALFFYLPNNPEARLAPQELGMTLYLLGALFFVAWQPRALGPALGDALFFACFTLALWSKETAFMPAAPVLVFVCMRRRLEDAQRRRASMALRLGSLAVWLHAATKAFVMSAAGGYGRPPLTADGLRTMTASVPQQVFLTGSLPWLWVAFVAGAVLCAWHQQVRPVSDRGHTWVVWAVLAWAMFQYLLLWQPVLRYAFPVTVILSLLTVVGFGAGATSAVPAAARYWVLGITAAALAVGATSYGHMTAQFAMQHVAGRGEQAALLGAEQTMRKMGVAVLHLRRASEYEYRAGVYFSDHLPRFEGRSVTVKAVRRPSEVASGGLLLARDAIPEAFGVVARFTAPPPPRIARWAEAVSLGARLGRQLPPPPVDAGAPGLQPSPWYLLRRPNP